MPFYGNFHQGVCPSLTNDLTRISSFSPYLSEQQMKHIMISFSWQKNEKEKKNKKQWFMLISVCTWENVIAKLKNRALCIVFLSTTFVAKAARKLFPKKSFCENLTLIFKFPEIWNMVLTGLPFFLFFIFKFCEAMMGQKTSMIFYLKKDSI